MDAGDAITCLWVLSGAFHLAAVVLLPYKLHTSRSAAGVSLKMQELYLLVHLTSGAVHLYIPFSWTPNSGMLAVSKIALTAITIGMMRCRPSLRASYDVSLDNFRSWAHAIIPAFVVTMVAWGSECSLFDEDTCWVDDDYLGLFMFLAMFSRVLEPFAIVPQLLVFRGCTDAGRLTGVFVSLMVASKAAFILTDILSVFSGEGLKALGSSDSGSITTSSPSYSASLLLKVLPLEIIPSIFEAVTLVVFLCDWRLRVSRRSPPGETGDMMEPNSAARERLLLNQDGKDEYSGDGGSAARLGISGGGGAAGDETRPSRRQQQGVGIVDRIEDVLLRERGQGRPSLPHSTSAAATTTRSEGGMRGDSGEVYLV